MLKLLDGKCWMTQNLRIAGRTLTPEDSDISDGTYFVPASSTSYNLTSDFTHHTLMNSRADFGAHYSWITATAGYSGEINAPNSICSKGWHLPSADEQRTFSEKYKNKTFRNPPVNLVAPGESYSNNGFCCNENDNPSDYDGWYWNKNYISCMYFSENSQDLGICDSKKCCGSGNYYGWSIRCTSD